MLDDLVEIALQHLRKLVYVGADLVIEFRISEQLVELADQFGGQRRKIVDKIEWILDLVCDAGSELAEGCKLLGLHQAVLGGAQFIDGFGQFAGASLNLLEQADVAERDHRLIGEGLQERDLLVTERQHLGTAKYDRANALTFA